MPRALTVLGDVDASELGAVNAHEHLLIRNGFITVRHPEFRLDDAERATQEVSAFHVAGGRTIVDATPGGIGRDPKGLVSISRRTGVRIIAATGFHKSCYYLDSHWRHHYAIEEIARLWTAEITDGMDQHGYEGPLVERSSARAGIIKVASDYQFIDAVARKAFEAAALAHLATGAPILTHSEMGTMMIEQVRLFESLGVAASRVIISHTDRNPDWFVHRDVAQTGAFLEYDCPGRVKYFPESAVVALIRKMFDLSLGQCILLGGDNARRSYWKAYGGGPGLAYILESFIPRLKREGFGDAEIHQLLVENPARAFAFQNAASIRAARPLEGS